MKNSYFLQGGICFQIPQRYVPTKPKLQYSHPHDSQSKILHNEEGKAGQILFKIFKYCFENHDSDDGIDCFIPDIFGEEKFRPGILKIKDRCAKIPLRDIQFGTL